MPERCPSCQSTRLERLGIGTERVEAIVRERFPDGARRAPGSRHRRRASGGGSGLDAILARMHAGEIDILVGTQMVTKGHDFPGVTLVGVLKPDQTMNLPDFRAAERTFQLLEQVAGRAGRGDRPGRVSSRPTRPTIRRSPPPRRTTTRASRAASWRRARRPATRRSRAWSRCASTRATAPRARAAATTAAEARPAGGGAAVTVRGPAEAPLAMLRGRIALAGLAVVARSRRGRRAPRAPARTRSAPRGDLRFAVDVDPHSTL